MSLRLLAFRTTPVPASPLRLRQLQAHIRRSGINTTTTTTRTMASLPKTMKGVIIEKTGGVDVLQWKTDLPMPVPQEGEVLVKNEYIGVNYIDTYFRTGLYPASMPYMLGREGEGTIASSSNSAFKEGDKVVYLNTSAYAEYTAVAAAKTHIIPSSLPPGIAAASLLQGLTALTLIREAHHVQAGDWVLVHAAAGGVGLWLCQLLSKVGAKVIGTASTQEKMQLAKENGAGWMINYKEEKEGFVGKVKAICGDEGVRCVFDSTGKDQFENDLEVVGRKGTVVSYGNSSGPVPPLTIAKLSAKNLKVCRPTLFNYIHTREEFEGYCAELFDFIIKDKLNVKIHETYPLQEVARAHTDLEGRKTTGKLLLKV